MDYNGLFLFKNGNTIDWWSELYICNELQWIFFSGIHYNQLESMGARCGYCFINLKQNESFFIDFNQVFFF